MATPRKALTLFPELSQPEPGKVRPPLKWAGGKRWQLPHLRPYWEAESHRRLVEPFCGGLAVALGLAPKRALLNDINPHLINFYKQLKKGFVSSLRYENKRTSLIPIGESSIVSLKRAGATLRKRQCSSII